MKRFADINARTNTHNIGVTRSLAALQPSAAGEPTPSIQPSIRPSEAQLPPAESQMGDKPATANATSAGAAAEDIPNME